MHSRRPAVTYTQEALLLGQPTAAVWPSLFTTLLNGTATIGPRLVQGWAPALRLLHLSMRSPCRAAIFTRGEALRRPVAAPPISSPNGTGTAGLHWVRAWIITSGP